MEIQIKRQSAKFSMWKSTGQLTWVRKENVGATEWGEGLLNK